MRARRIIRPAFPAWFLEASRRLTGAVGWPAYVISQIFVAATFGFAYLLGRELMGWMLVGRKRPLASPAVPFRKIKRNAMKVSCSCCIAPTRDFDL